MDLIASYNLVDAGVHLTTDRQRALIIFVSTQGEVGVTMSRRDLENLGEQISRELKRRRP